MTTLEKLLYRLRLLPLKPSADLQAIKSHTASSGIETKFLIHTTLHIPGQRKKAASFICKKLKVAKKRTLFLKKMLIYGHRIRLSPTPIAEAFRIPFIFKKDD